MRSTSLAPAAILAWLLLACGPPSKHEILSDAEGATSKAELERWVGLESLPSTIEFLPHTVPQIFNSKHRDDDTAPKHLLLFSSSELPSVPRPPRAPEAASESPR